MIKPLRMEFGNILHDRDVEASTPIFERLDTASEEYSAPTIVFPLHSIGCSGCHLAISLSNSDCWYAYPNLKEDSQVTDSGPEQ